MLQNASEEAQASNPVASSKKRKVVGSKPGTASLSAASVVSESPMSRLEGHLHCVSSCTWPVDSTVYSGGWDHSVSEVQLLGDPIVLPSLVSGFNSEISIRDFELLSPDFHHRTSGAALGCGIRRQHRHLQRQQGGEQHCFKQRQSRCGRIRRLRQGTEGLGLKVPQGRGTGGASK